MDPKLQQANMNQEQTASLQILETISALIFCNLFDLIGQEIFETVIISWPEQRILLFFSAILSHFNAYTFQQPLILLIANYIYEHYDPLNHLHSSILISLFSFFNIEIINSPNTKTFIEKLLQTPNGIEVLSSLLNSFFNSSIHDFDSQTKESVVLFHNFLPRILKCATSTRDFDLQISNLIYQISTSIFHPSLETLTIIYQISLNILQFPTIAVKNIIIAIEKALNAGIANDQLIKFATNSILVSTKAQIADLDEIYNAIFRILSHFPRENVTNFLQTVECFSQPKLNPRACTALYKVLRKNSIYLSLFTQLIEKGRPIEVPQSPPEVEFLGEYLHAYSKLIGFDQSLSNLAFQTAVTFCHDSCPETSLFEQELRLWCKRYSCEISDAEPFLTSFVESKKEDLVCSAFSIVHDYKDTAFRLSFYSSAISHYLEISDPFVFDLIQIMNVEDLPEIRGKLLEFLVQSEKTTDHDTWFACLLNVVQLEILRKTPLKFDDEDAKLVGQLIFEKRKLITPDLAPLVFEFLVNHRINSVHAMRIGMAIHQFAGDDQRALLFIIKQIKRELPCKEMNKLIGFLKKQINPSTIETLVKKADLYIIRFTTSMIESNISQDLLDLKKVLQALLEYHQALVEIVGPEALAGSLTATVEQPFILNLMKMEQTGDVESFITEMIQMSNSD